jgi:phage tail sheath protein FI
MPDDPEVSIEEAPYGPAPIEGVATDIAAFLGETADGPTEPTRVYSLLDYQRLFGTGAGLMADAVGGFFANGGRRAVIARVIGGGHDAALAGLEGAAAAGVSLVYAPDCLSTPGLAERLIAHCERLRDRFAVVDAPRSADPKAPRAGWDSRYAAYYYPWIAVADPATGATRLVPPGGHVLGVYARVDTERGVFKAPANELVRGAVALEHDVTDREQDILNPLGVNVIRRFAGRGILVWGARTLSSDPEWKYISVRRYFIFLERSIHDGLQWVVFEPNGERLWAKVRDTVREFLRGQWRVGALQGQTEDKAFFVRCDRTTMTQADLDSGRLICEIGVAPVKPAEFVIVRIGLWTADHHPPP